MYLLVVFWCLALHAGFLWRDYLADRLRVELLLLECELAALASLLGPADREELLRLRSLFSTVGRNAETVFFSRLLLAALFCRRATNYRQRLAALTSVGDRPRALDIYDRFEDAVARKVMAGSPLFWVARLLVRPLQRVPGVHLLSATFPNQDPELS